MAKIAYTNKVTASTIAAAEINKITAANMNEIKISVNVNVDDIAAEIINRASADTALQNNIDAEVTDRENAVLLKANVANPTFTGTVGGITKSMVGLGNVDNTSDANKPVSTPQATALALKLDKGTFTGNAQNLNNSIKNQLSEGVYVINSNSASPGKYLNTSGTLTALAGYDVNKYPIVAGKTILIKGVINATAAMAVYAFGTESGSVTIDQSTRVDQAIGENTYNIEVIVPTGMTYLFLNKDIANNVYVGHKLSEIISNNERLSNLASKRQLTEAVNILDVASTSVGYINTESSLVSNSSFKVSKIAVNIGDSLIISGIVNNSLSIGMAIYAFGTTSSTGSILSSTQVNQLTGENAINESVVVPETATFLFVNKDLINNISVGVVVSTIIESLRETSVLKDKLQLSEGIYKIKSFSETIGGYVKIDKTVGFTSGLDFNKFPVKEGQLVIISGTIDVGSRTDVMKYGLSADSNLANTSIQVNYTSTGFQEVNLEVLIPSGITFIFVNKDTVNQLVTAVKIDGENAKTIQTGLFAIDATRFLSRLAGITTATGTTASLRYQKWKGTVGKKYTIKGRINTPVEILLYAFGKSDWTGDIIPQTIVTIPSGDNIINLEFEVPKYFPYFFLNNDLTYGALTVTENLKSAQKVIELNFNETNDYALDTRIYATKGLIHHNSSLIPENTMSMYINSLKCTEEFKDFKVEFNIAPFDSPFTHTHCMDIDSNGNVYIVYMLNTVNNNEEPDELRLHKFHIDSPTVVERFDVFITGTTYNGFALTSFVFDPNLKVVGDKVFINCSMQFTGTPYVVACRPFNISTGLFDNVHLLNFVYEGTTYQLNNTNINAALKHLGIAELGFYQAIQPNVSKRVEDGVNWYYTGLGSVQYFQGAILKTTDFINYHFVATPNLKGIVANYETGVYVIGDYVWMVIRQIYGRNTVALTRYSIVNDEFDQVIYLEDTTSRCTFMEDSGKLYLLVSPVTREEILFLEIDKTDLTQSKFVQGVNEYSAFYQMAQKHNGKYYCVYTSSIAPNIKNQVRFCEFSMQSITKTTINNYFKTAFSL